MADPTPRLIIAGFIGMLAFCLGWHEAAAGWDALPMIREVVWQEVTIPDRQQSFMVSPSHVPDLLSRRDPTWSSLRMPGYRVFEERLDRWPVNPLPTPPVSHAHWPEFGLLSPNDSEVK